MSPCRFGIVTNRFKALSNFTIEIEVEVTNPSGNGVLGYICTVTLYDGKNLGYVMLTCVTLGNLWHVLDPAGLASTLFGFQLSS
jgi:hypothetical protein